MADRMRRVNESVRQVLSEAVGQLKDPRIGFVTVTGVETSPDLRHARVFVSVLGAERKRRETMAGLQAAHSVLQTRLARELRMKRTPQLAFEYDPSVERGVRMTKLIDELAPDDSEWTGGGRGRDSRSRSLRRHDPRESRRRRTGLSPRREARARSARKGHGHGAVRRSASSEGIRVHAARGAGATVAGRRLRARPPRARLRQREPDRRPR